MDNCLKKAVSGSVVSILNLFFGLNCEITRFAGVSNSTDIKNHLVDRLSFGVGLANWDFLAFFF